MVTAVAPVVSAVLTPAVASDVSWSVSGFVAVVWSPAAAYFAAVKMTFVASVESVASAASAAVVTVDAAAVTATVAAAAAA